MHLYLLFLLNFFSPEFGKSFVPLPRAARATVSGAGPKRPQEAGPPSPPCGPAEEPKTARSGVGGTAYTPTPGQGPLEGEETSRRIYSFILNKSLMSTYCASAGRTAGKKGIMPARAGC